MFPRDVAHYGGGMSCVGASSRRSSQSSRDGSVDSSTVQVTRTRLRHSCTTINRQLAIRQVKKSGRVDWRVIR
jgi:hypothetical protein